MTISSPSNQKGLPGARVAKSLEYVDYQDGAIARREVVRTSAGSVAVLAFDEGQSVGEHTAPFHALVHVLEGDAEINVAGNPHRLQGGEMIFIPARQSHALKALTPFKMILTKLRSEA